CVRDDVVDEDRRPLRGGRRLVVGAREPIGDRRGKARREGAAPGREKIHDESLRLQHDGEAGRTLVEAEKKERRLERHGAHRVARESAWGAVRAHHRDDRYPGGERSDDGPEELPVDTQGYFAG